MLRSLLLGVLALSTASACKGSSDAPAVQPGAAVGKVVEMSGDVSATRGAAKRALASGQEISGDDVIETGTQANVRILFAHNNATWDLGPNKKQLVSESLAWKAPKADEAAADVSEATLAAGRHAERETVTTGTTAPPPPSQAAAVDPGSAPGGSPSDKKADPAPRDEEKATKPSRKRDTGAANTKGGGTKEAAPIDRDDSRDDGRAEESMPAKTARGGEVDTMRLPTAPIVAPKDSPPPPPPPPSEVATKNATEEVRGAVSKQRTALAKCLDTATLSVDVVVAKGKATFVFPAGTSDNAKSCFAAIAAKLSFPADYDVKTTMSFKK